MTVEDRENVKTAVEWIRKLFALNCIPKNPKRDLSDEGIHRLMDTNVKQVVVMVEEYVNRVGLEFDTRFATEELCKTYGIRISFVPTEQDCCGWVMAKMVTEKGSFHYG
ncbi:hypothetical protein ACSA002_0530 [Salmonella phage vB_SalM_SA002]|nr:hypothetical protein ACSA002_0530 [Salmonella phage vB_SalM_SA002]